jgi:FAD/FMN-containing dehydrogenase
MQKPLAQVAIGLKLGEAHSSRCSAYKKEKYQIDISLLTSILEVNQSEEYAAVEALVTFEKLSKATLQYGLLPAVIPEFKTITIESTSWNFILSSSEAPELWKAVSGSNGTLTLVIAARIRLVKATK